MNVSCPLDTGRRTNPQNILSFWKRGTKTTKQGIRGYYKYKPLTVYFLRKLPISQRLWIISCLPKCDKPRELKKNLRPTTLFNDLYKFISWCVKESGKFNINIWCTVWIYEGKVRSRAINEFAKWPPYHRFFCKVNFKKKINLIFFDLKNRPMILWILFFFADVIFWVITLW